MADPESPKPEADNARLARLREEAELEMRRRLPPSDGDGGRAAKRHKAAEAAANGGRFDYGALRELESGITGFLLTCPIQRENSARKEALPLLGRHLQQCSGSSGGAAEVEAAPLAAIKVSCRGVVALRLAACPAAAAAASAGGSTAAGAAAAAEGGASSTPSEAAAELSAAVTEAPASPSAEAFDLAAAALVADAAAALLGDVESGSQGRLAHVQRIVPVQTSCRLEAEALQRAGAQLAALVAAAASAGKGGSGSVHAAAASADSEPASDQAAPAAQPPPPQQHRVTFGIALKQREAAAAAGEAGDGGLSRGAIIAAVASGFETALRQQHGIAAAVDLKAPGWVLVVEALPAGGAQYAALAALPARLCQLKPKLHIRPVGSRGL